MDGGVNGLCYPFSIVLLRCTTPDFGWEMRWIESIGLDASTYRERMYLSSRAQPIKGRQFPRKLLSAVYFRERLPVVDVFWLYDLLDLEID